MMKSGTSEQAEVRCRSTERRHEMAAESNHVWGETIEEGDRGVNTKLKAMEEKKKENREFRVLKVLSRQQSVCGY